MLDLSGKNALITGIANNRSIAWGIAQQLHKAGANICVTYLPDEKGRFEKKVRDVVKPISPTIILPCDVQDELQIQETFNHISNNLGKLDILIHCLAFSDKEGLEGDYSNISREVFNQSLDISTFSLGNMVKYAKPIMNEGGSILTLTYVGGVKVMPNCNLMGIAKAGLEMSVRYLANELGPDNIRINAISAGPMRTLASSAVGGILDMINHVEKVAPLKRTVTQLEVGNTAAFLCSDLASGITGQIVYVDAGYTIMGM